MRHPLRFAYALLAAIITLNGFAQARPDSTPKIAFDDFNPAAGVGEIKAKGTYTLGKGPGLSVQSFVVECAPVQGGDVASSKCKWKNGKWEGAITKLSARKYNFHAQMTVKDANGKEVTYSSAFWVETVR